MNEAENEQEVSIVCDDNAVREDVAFFGFFIMSKLSDINDEPIMSALFWRQQHFSP